MDRKKFTGEQYVTQKQKIISVAKKLLALTEELCELDAECATKHENNERDVQLYNMIMQESGASFFKIVEKLK